MLYPHRSSLIVSSDCGFGRRGCNRKIAFYKASAIAQGCNIARREQRLSVTHLPAVNLMLQIDRIQARRIETATNALTS